MAPGRALRDASPVAGNCFYGIVAFDGFGNLATRVRADGVAAP